MFSTLWKQQGCFSLDCKNLISTVASVLLWTRWVYWGSWPSEVTGAGSCVTTRCPNVTAPWQVTAAPREPDWGEGEDGWWEVAVGELRHLVTACHQLTSAAWCRQDGACCSSTEELKGGWWCWLELGERPVVIVREGCHMLAVILLMS